MLSLPNKCLCTAILFGFGVRVKITGGFEFKAKPNLPNGETKPNPL